MGIYFVYAFLFVFTLAIGQALLRRKLDPYREVPWAELPAALREEAERALPGFEPQEARITKSGNEVRVFGRYQGRGMRIEGEFDRKGAMVEFEADGEGGMRTRAVIAPEELPGAVLGEAQRLLGDVFARLEKRRAVRGTAGDEDSFGVYGRHAGWKYEVEVTRSGRLLSFEKELRSAH